MAVTLNASTSSGLVQTADTSGQIQLQSNGTTELTVTSTGVTVADNLLFNSGYGSAVIGYGCRAWVNFNGTGTVAIRASGNVTSITDNGTGDYTVNITTAMPDTNYSVNAIGYSDNVSYTLNMYLTEATAPTASLFRVSSMTAHSVTHGSTKNDYD
jgi:uncharacterized protein (AIM24 family)